MDMRPEPAIIRLIPYKNDKNYKRRKWNYSKKRMQEAIALMETGEYVQWTLEFHKPVKEPGEKLFSVIGYIMVVLGVYAPSEELIFNNVEMGYQLEWFSDPYKYEEIIALMHGLSNTVQAVTAFTEQTSEFKLMDWGHTWTREGDRVDNRGGDGMACGYQAERVLLGKPVNRRAHQGAGRRKKRSGRVCRTYGVKNGTCKGKRGCFYR